MSSFGIEGIVRMVSHLVFIYITYWALQSIRTDQIFKKNSVNQIRVIFLFLSIIIGYLISSFFIEMMTIFRNFTEELWLS